MDALWFTIGFTGTLTGLAVLAYFMGARLVREAEEHDMPLLDYGALESDLTAYVQADLNRPNKAA